MATSPTYVAGQIAVVGCGTIGSSWALAFGSAGFTVRCWDPQPHFARAMAAWPVEVMRRIAICDTVAEAVDGADFVQESGPERLDLKAELLASMAATLPAHAVVASSTSTIMPSLLQQDCTFGERVLIGHPFNPPHLIPLVEVVGGAATSRGSIEIAMDLYRRAGKHPIHLRLERPGHLANRLQAAIWREAIDAVASGQADVADVDAAVTLALGPRWALTGPFATFNLGGGPGGLRHFLDHLGPAFTGLWHDLRTPVVDAALTDRLVAETDAAQGGRSVAELAAARDAVLGAVLDAGRMLNGPAAPAPSQR